MVRRPVMGIVRGLEKAGLKMKVETVIMSVCREK